MDIQSKSVTLEQVSKIFKDPQSGKDVHAVDGADFVIAPGELVTLLGPSGCGKMTTFRMIAGFELPTREDHRRRDITFLLQQTGSAMVFRATVFPAYERLRQRGLRAAPSETRRTKSREGHALPRHGEQNTLAKRPSRLSGGQQQRVALRALIVSPPSCCSTNRSPISTRCPRADA